MPADDASLHRLAEPKANHEKTLLAILFLAITAFFNTDQGCQFTSNDWIGTVKVLGVKVSMDGFGTI